MDDLISRQAAIAAVGYYSLHSGDKLLFADAPLKALPTVDPVRHGRWDLIDGCEPVRYGCSVCHRLVWHYENYCPSCGAQMILDEVEQDEID